MGNKAKKKKSQPGDANPAPSTAAAMTDVPLTETGQPLFTLDLNPPKVKLASIPILGDPADEHDDAQPGAPETRMNREARRRLDNIERYRKEVKRSLRMPEDSAQTTPEIEKRVAAWARAQDVKKAKQDDARHARRKAKTAAAESRQSREMRKRARGRK